MVASYDPSVRAFCGRGVLTLALLFCAWAAAPARAQSANSGAISLTAGVDAPSVYIFRGLVRERDPKVTVSPYGGLSIALRGERTGSATDVPAGSVIAHVGVWNSLQSGSSGSEGFTEHSHYEEDFYAGLTVGLGTSLRLTALYTAYTSPNFQFNTVREVAVKVAHADRVHPYALIASELGDAGLDNGLHAGTYLEVGVGPRFDFWGASTISVPVRTGVSVKDYYELNGSDRRFGYLSVGGLLTIPLRVPSRLGAWNIHGGVDVYRLGEFTKAANEGKASKVVGTFGVALAY